MRDSVDLAPGEAVQLDNFVLDKFGVLHKRYGVQNWNDSLLSGGHIRDILYVEQKDGDKYLYVATDTFIYQLDGWTDTVEVWAGKEIDYTRGTIDSDTDDGQKYIYGDTTSWILSVQAGDKIQLQGGGGIYTIDSVLADTLIAVTGNLTVVGDTFAAYRVLKAVQGNPQLSTWNGNLYVADDGAPAWWYDGDEPYTLSIVDSGTITYALEVDTTATAYETGIARIEKGNQIVKLVGADISDTAFTAGNLFHARYEGYRRYSMDARILDIAVLGLDTAIYIDNPYWVGGTGAPHVVTLPDTLRPNPEDRWWIDHTYMRKNLGQSQYAEDSNKIWQPNYYQGLYIINGNNTLKAAFVTDNSDRTIDFEGYGTTQLDRIQPDSIFDSYAYKDTINDYEIVWTSPGSGTDTAMVCDSMVQYINDDANVNSDVTAIDSATYYIIKSDTMGKAFSITVDTVQTIKSGGVANDSSKLVFAIDDRYYIGWQFPSVDSAYWEGSHSYHKQYSHETIFSHIIFHRNRLYAIGYDLAKQTSDPLWHPRPPFDESDTINTGRVWYSDLGIPTYIPSDQNFDVSGANNEEGAISLYSSDRCRSQFVLRDDLYILTNSSIYRISGEIDLTQPDLGIYLTQAIKGVGSKEPNASITTKDNNAYIMNTEGIWWFDGRTIRKISYRIDPLMEQYRNSSMVAGQFKDNIFFSYPDSDVTVVLHEPTQAFTLWDFGMECMNNQFVAIDSNYFLFSTSTDSAYILKYPRDYAIYCDTWDGSYCADYAVTYRSGWQTFGQPLDLKAIDWVALLYNKGAGNLIYNLNVDSLGSVVTISADTMINTGRRIRKFAPPNDRQGNLFQSHLTAQTAGDITLSEILLRWFVTGVGVE
jgi:hypothetical protein